MSLSQIGLTLGEKWWRQNWLKILAELIWNELFCEIRVLNFTPQKTNIFDFQSIKKKLPGPKQYQSEPFTQYQV